MSVTDPRSGIVHSFGLGYSTWHTDMDNNLKKIGEAGFHLSVKDRNLSTPPVSPTLGDSYIVGPSPTGLWAGHANDIAVCVESGSPIAWRFYTPRIGWIAYIEDELGDAAYGGGSPTGWSNSRPFTW